MLRIAVCDDCVEDLTRICDMTKSLLNSLSIQYEMEKYTNGNDLLNCKISFDLILLDIEMENKSGIEVAREIRTFDQDTKIVFITNSEDYLRVGYTVSANRYFIKPIDEKEFNFEITCLLKQSLLDNKFIMDHRISPYKLYFKDIVYIEFYNRKTLVHTKKDSLSTVLTLKEWMELLENMNFSRVHKAYIVNLNYVNGFKGDFVGLSNAIELPLGRKFKEDFKKDYYNMIGERI